MEKEKIKAVDKDSKIKTAQSENDNEIGGAEIRHAPPFNMHKERTSSADRYESDIHEIPASKQDEEDNPFSEHVSTPAPGMEFASHSYPTGAPIHILDRRNDIKTVRRDDKVKTVPPKKNADVNERRARADSHGGHGDKSKKNADVSERRSEEAEVSTSRNGDSGAEKSEPAAKKYTVKKKKSASAPRRSGRVISAIKAGHKTARTASRGIRGVRSAAQKSRNTVSRAKSAGEQSVGVNDGTPEQYAGDRVADFEAWTASKGANVVRRGARRTAGLAVRTVAKAGKQTVKAVRKAGEKASKGVRRQAVKQTGDTAIKTAKTSVKTAQQALKTSEEAARAGTKAVAETAKVTMKAAQAAAKAAANAARATAQAAAKAAQVISKAVVAAGQAIASFIAAGGWVILLAVLALVVIVAVVVILVSSVDGIFSGTVDPDTGLSVRAAVDIIDSEYQARIEEIKADAEYDIVEITGEPEPWRNVLAIYAVSVVTNPDNPQDAATMDSDKLDYLRGLYWDMTSVSFQLVPDPSETTAVPETTLPPETTIPTETTFETVPETEPETEPPTYLYITVSCVDFDEYIADLGLTEQQLDEIERLMSGEYDDLWDALLT